MNLIMDLKNYETGDSVFKRTAARAIIRKGGKYLLIFSKYGDYKFPGGGLEEAETLEEALIREVKEETGYQAIAESVKKYGVVLEKRKGQREDILEMDSHYFFCDVKAEAGSRNLDEYEKEYDYQIIWVTLEEAVKRNRQVADLKECPWVMRETKVMEALMNETH